MDHNNGKTNVVKEGMIQIDSPQESSTPLLPKNCVALVGNTPIVLGQKVVFMSSNSNTLEGMSKVQSDTAKSLNKVAKTDLTTTVGKSSPHAHATSHATTKNVFPSPQVASPGLGASHVMKALACETFKKSLGKDSIIMKPLGTSQRMPGQTRPVKQFRISGNVSVRHLLSKGIRLNVPRKPELHSAAVLSPNSAPRKRELHPAAVLSPNSAPKKPESQSTAVLSPNSAQRKTESHSAAVLLPNSAQRKTESHSAAVLSPNSAPRKPESHSAAVLSPNSASRKSESHSVAVLSPVTPGRNSTKPQIVFGTSSLKSVNSPKPRMIEETLSDTPKEVPSGSIMVNLQGQAVKIVGLPPAVYTQSTASRSQRTEKPLPNLKPKTFHLQSIYDQKIKALKDKHAVSRKSTLSVSAVNKPIAPRSQAANVSQILTSATHGHNKLIVSQSQATSVSQILTSASHRQSRSMFIGNSNLASLTPHSQSYILTNAHQIRTSPNIIKSRDIFKTPNSDHSTGSVITSFGTIYKSTNTSTQPSSTLQTILKAPFATKTSDSVDINPYQQISDLTTASHQYLASLAINKSKTTPSNEAIKLVDQGERTVSSGNLHFFTSTETGEEGQSVMVVRPVLDSDDNHSKESKVGSEDTKMDGSHAYNSLRNNTLLDPPIPFSLDAKHSEPSKTTTYSDNQKIDSSSDLKIQSVFSLANISSTFDMLNNKESDGGSDTDSAIIDVDDEDEDDDDEDEVTFNIYDNDWKKMCPPSYVVLERLYPQDIEDKKMGRNSKVLVQCSPHCRERTLAYLCELNLMLCEHRPRVKDDPSTSSIEKINLSTSAATAVDVDEYDEIEKDSSIIPKDNSENEVITESLSAKEIDDGINNVGVEPERPTQPLTKDTQYEECQLDTGRQKVEEEKGSPHMQNNSNTGTDKVIQVVELQAQEDKEPSVLSPIGAPSKLTETKESAQLKSDLISLKRQVERKRFEMKMQKKLHKLQSKAKVVKRRNIMSEGSKALPKQRSGKLPVVIHRLLKPKTALSHQSDLTRTKHSGAFTKSQESLVQKCLPSTLNPSVNTIPSSPPTYVLNCPASSLFENSGDNGSQQTSRPTSSIMSSISPLPLIMNNSSPQAPKSTVKLPLAKVYAALKSLSTQMEKTGHKPEGTQLVMIKTDNAAVLLKVQPQALLPENLEALHKAAFAPTTSNKQTSQVMISPMNKAPTLTTAKSKITSSVTSSYVTVMNYHSSPSAASSTSSTRTVPSTFSALNKKVRISSISKDGKLKQKCSNVPSSSSATSSTGMQNIQNSLQCSPVFPSSSFSGRQVSILPSSQSGVHHHPHSSPSLRSLLTKSAYTYNDARSALTRVPSNSSLLPERQKKRPSDSLSEEEKAAKRRKLEVKYPLPPGVIIKTEPDTSEYDIGNDWSVTTDIETGFVNASEIADSMTATDVSSRAGNNMSNIHAPVEDQQSEVLYVDSNNMAEDDTEITDSPPPLQMPFAMEKDSGVCQEENENETPPVLQPMPSITARPPLLEEKEKSNYESGSSVEDRQRKSSLASGENSTRIYDSGYDSVSTSSSAGSLIPEWTQSEQPVNSAKTKIQKLKELLRQKELQVENMRKKRSEMPEVDLNAL